MKRGSFVDRQRLLTGLSTEWAVLVDGEEGAESSRHKISRTGPERKAANRMTVGTRYSGFAVTLIKSYSRRQRTEKPAARLLPTDG